MNFQGFVDSLQYMLFGMLGIFIVIGIIALIVWLLQVVFPEKKKD